MAQLTSAQDALKNRARKLAEKNIHICASEVDRSEEYPWANVELLKQAGFMGMTLPKSFGGQGLTYFDAVLVIEEMARVCGVTARIVVEANMGGIGAIMAYGTDAQKRLAADLVLAGDKPAICITEPSAGSAATEMSTTAVRRGNTYVINGRKHWITGGGVSRLHLVFARVVEDGEQLGIGGFICVRNETEGLVIGKREPAMGLRGIPETEVLFDNMEIHESMLVMPPEGLKRGFASLMSTYNAQRIGAATVALGIAQGAFELAVDYAKKREQFGRPIAEFQGLQWMLTDMSIGLASARALIHEAVVGAGAGFPDMRAAAQAKVLASETAINAAAIRVAN